MKKRVKSILKNNQGFTLIELIAVMTIMGFLVAMIVPRLTGVVSSATDQVCDTNQQRLRTVTETFLEQTGFLPNHLTNLVIETASGTYATTGDPGFVDDDNKDNGKEAISGDLDAMVRLKVHYLNQEEADELKDLGITKVFNLNLKKDVDGAYRGPEASEPYMEEVDVAAGVPVLMVGAGADATGTWDDSQVATGEKFGNPDLMFRIVLGTGSDCQLVTDGRIQSAALCPAGMQREDHFVYNNYNLVIPRLQATVDRMVADDVQGCQATETLEIEVTNDETTETKTHNLLEAQEPWQFTTVCPEGCQLMGIDAAQWNISAVNNP